MKKKQLLGGLVVLALLIALLIQGRDKIHFDFGAFRTQLAMASWSRIGLALLCIYLGYVLRSIRWAALMRHNKKVGPFTLLGTQVIGFTAIALIGRVADLVRPWLVARKTGEPITNQVAVYIVERLFDFGSMALLFSCVILFSPYGSIPHPEVVRRAAILGLIGTMAGALFLVAVRLFGKLIAAFLENLFNVFSRTLGHSVGNKIRAFHEGLDTIRSFSDFASATVLSLVMWGLISLSYLLTMLAFTASPEFGRHDSGPSRGL